MTLNNTDIKNFSETFEQARQWWLSEQAKQKLKDLFFQLPQTEQKKVLEKYANLKTEPEKSFFDWLKIRQDNLKANIETQNSKFGFESLEKDFEQKEATKELLDVFGDYVDLSLDSSFSKQEKDNIKLVMLYDIETNIWENIFSGISSKLVEPFKKAIENFKSNKSLKEKKMNY